MVPSFLSCHIRFYLKLYSIVNGKNWVRLRNDWRGQNRYSFGDKWKKNWRVEYGKTGAVYINFQINFTAWETVNGFITYVTSASMTNSHRSEIFNEFYYPVTSVWWRHRPGATCIYFIVLKYHDLQSWLLVVQTTCHSKRIFNFLIAFFLFFTA